MGTSVMVSSASSSPWTSNGLSEDYEDHFYPDGDRIFHRNGEDEEERDDIGEVEELRHLIRRSPLFPPFNLPIKILCLKPPFKKLCKPKLPLKKKLGKREAEDYEDFSYSDEGRVFHRNVEDEEEWGKISEADEPRHLVKRNVPKIKKTKLKKLKLKKLFVKKSP